jgi:endothelin-converting enzyme/putative endopeptidase
MSPQTVNAYYNPAYKIVFPAAIQAPFYNYQADEAVNYGGIGAVIGHEISLVLMTRVLVTMQMEI